MNPTIEIKKQPKSQVEIFATLPAGDFDACVEQALEELGKEAEIQGFRKGAAPKKMVEASLGERKILDRAATIAVNAMYFKILIDNKIDAIGSPNIEVLKIARNNPLEVKITLYTLPEIKLPDYKAIAGNVKINKVEVDEKEINESLAWLQSSLAKFSEKPDAAQSGDWVEIKFSINGEPEVKDAFILGKGRLLEDMEKNIISMKAGESKEFAFKFPQGQEAKCKLKLDLVKKVELPEINDAFAKTVGEFENLEALKNKIKEDARHAKEHQEKDRAVSEVISRVAEKVELEIPDILVSREVEAAMQNIKNRVGGELQMTFEEYLKRVKKTEEEFAQSLRPEARKKIKHYLILKEMQKEEKIEVSEQEINEECKKLTEQYPDINNAKGKFDQAEFMEYTKERIENQKIIRKIEDILGK